MFCIGQAIALSTDFWRGDMHKLPAEALRKLCSASSNVSGSTTTTFVFGWALAIAGSFVRVAAFRTLGTLFTYELTVAEDHKLVTSGPYAWVRHPSYTGLIGNALGVAICAFGDGSWIRQCNAAKTWAGMVVIYMMYAGMWLPALILFPMRTLKEDAMMKKQYGKQWDEWSQKVRYRLVPGLW